MPDTDPLIASLEAAVAASPHDVPLRLHLAELLRNIGRVDEAVRAVAAALVESPADVDARESMARMLGVTAAPSGAAAPRAAWAGRAESAPPGAVPGAQPPAALTAALSRTTAAAMRSPRAAAAEPSPTAPPTSPAEPEEAEEALTGTGPTLADEADETDDGWAVERERVTLADVGGMAVAKEGLTAAILAPMRNPELRLLYRTSRAGGVLLYGPPGCGKTFLARAIAGELGVSFHALDFDVVVADHLPEAEHLVAAAFAQAREDGSALLYLDEVDVLCRASAAGRHEATRALNRLAMELDGASTGEGRHLLVLAATSAPWDVSARLRRRGRLERTLLVMPPDQHAREVILREELDRVPDVGDDVDIAELALRTEGFSGQDLIAVARRAGERRDADAGRGPRPVDDRDLRRAVLEVGASTPRWLELARDAARRETDDLSYAGLREYLAARRRW